jgi:hypothetical protein
MYVQFLLEISQGRDDLRHVGLVCRWDGNIIIIKMELKETGCEDSFCREML